MQSYHGVDPLDPNDDHDVTKQILIDQKKRGIQNVLKSYTGFYDLFSELIQNALDACEKKYETDNSDNYLPQIEVVINLR